jgi:hypothetical protein
MLASDDDDLRAIAFISDIFLLESISSCFLHGFTHEGVVTSGPICAQSNFKFTCFQTLELLGPDCSRRLALEEPSWVLSSKDRSGELCVTSTSFVFCLLSESMYSSGCVSRHFARPLSAWKRKKTNILLNWHRDIHIRSGKVEIYGTHRLFGWQRPMKAVSISFLKCISASWMCPCSRRSAPRAWRGGCILHCTITSNYQDNLI